MKAIRRDLNRLANEFKGPAYDAIKAAGRAVATPIAARARAALPSGPRTDGTLQGDVRVSATKTGAGVRMGRKSVPYAGWVEFGGSRPDGSVRAFVKDGRYLFPAAYGLAPQAAKAYSDALAKLFDSNNAIWTNTSADPGSVHD